MSGENNFKDTVNSLFKGLDAFRSFTVTSCPPSSYVPFFIPVARMESLIKMTLSGPNIQNVALITDG